MRHEKEFNILIMFIAFSVVAIIAIWTPKLSTPEKIISIPTVYAMNLVFSFLFLGTTRTKAPTIKSENKCYYSNESCWYDEQPYEGSIMCTNCLLAKHIGGFHPEKKRKEVN